MPRPAVTATAAMPAIKAFFAVIRAMAFVAVVVAVVAIAVPERAAAVETETANPIGAAWTALAEMTAVRAAVEQTIPRLVKKRRSFSTARFTRILVASSLAPRAAPISFMLLSSKNRSATASWSASLNPAIAASRIGAI